MTDQQHERGGVQPLGPVAVVIVLLLCGDGVMVSQGIPQGWTQLADVKMPRFFGYMVDSFVFLLPLYFVMVWLFL